MGRTFTPIISEHEKPKEGRREEKKPNKGAWQVEELEELLSDLEEEKDDH